MFSDTKLNQLHQEGKISHKTYESVKIAKSYIEKKYSMKRIKEEKKKKEWDIINEILESANLSNNDKEEIKQSAIQKETDLRRKKYSYNINP